MNKTIPVDVHNTDRKVTLLVDPLCYFIGRFLPAVVFVLLTYMKYFLIKIV